MPVIARPLSCCIRPVILPSADTGDSKAQKTQFFQALDTCSNLPKFIFQKPAVTGQKMKFIALFFFCMLMNMLADARSIQDGDGLYQEGVAMPYWPFSANDFWSYVEYFRTLGAYDRINEMAKTLFAQLPFGSHLGYNVPNHEH